MERFQKAQFIRKGNEYIYMMSSKDAKIVGNKKKKKRKQTIFRLSPQLLAFILFLCSLTTVAILLQMKMLFSEGADLRMRFHEEKRNITLGYVVGGETWVRKWFINHMKSLVLNTKENLFFHIITDNETSDSLRIYLETWDIDRINVTFYDIKQYENRINWIPNHHYSKNYGLIKLVLPDILTVDKILFIDIDTLIRCDIKDLWYYFETMSSDQAIGVASNQSPWYIKNDSRRAPSLSELFSKKWSMEPNTKPSYRFWSVWPSDYVMKLLFTASRNLKNTDSALSRNVDSKNTGINTGVMLLDLQKLRSIGWNKLWKETAIKYLRTFGATKLADQDIYNAIFFSYPHFVQMIPCEFNYQQGMNNNGTYCDDYAKVIHWNSEQKIASDTYQTEDLNAYRKSIEAFNGDSIKSRRNAFHTKRKMNELYTICGEYLPEETYRTFPNVLKPAVNNDEISIFTQMSTDRLQHFKTMAESWQQSISVAVYGTDDELNKVLSAIQEINRTNIAVHLVYKAVDDKVYPINYLRNVALKYTTTAFVLSLDVDFRVRLKSEDVSKHLEQLESKQAYVVPAFELTSHSYKFDNNEVPKTKKDAEEMLRNGTLQSFRRTIFPAGQDPTNATMWAKSRKVYEVEWRPNYEPYILMRKSEIPLYENNFGGFGWNKVTHIMAMKSKEFQFLVLPDSFAIHQFHTPSEDLIKFRTDKGYRNCLRYMKTQFIRRTILKDRIDIDNL